MSLSYNSQSASYSPFPSAVLHLQHNTKRFSHLIFIPPVSLYILQKKKKIDKHTISHSCQSSWIFPSRAPLNCPNVRAIKLEFIHSRVTPLTHTCRGRREMEIWEFPVLLLTLWCVTSWDFGNFSEKSLGFSTILPCSPISNSPWDWIDWFPIRFMWLGIWQKSKGFINLTKNVQCVAHLLCFPVKKTVITQTKISQYPDSIPLVLILIPLF